MGVGGWWRGIEILTDDRQRTQTFLFFLPPAVLTEDHLTDGDAWACQRKTPQYSHSCLQEIRNEMNQPELLALWAGDEVFGGLSLQPVGKNP